MVQVIGAGFGRTGTNSLKLALETLLGGPCYHMVELFQRPTDALAWTSGISGGDVDWAELLDGWSAVVDFPGCSATDELAAAFPDAKILLSTRDPESWWASADRTIFVRAREAEPGTPPGDMVAAMLGRVGVDPDDRDRSIAAFVAHEQRICEQYADRLIEWRPGDGWEPLCAGLGVAVPDEPYPHTNTSEGFDEMVDAARRGDVERNAVPPLDYR